jgi:hypothetical protein
VLGYLIKRTITRSDEDRKEMQKEAKAKVAEIKTRYPKPEGE